MQCALCHPLVSIPPPPKCADPNFFCIIAGASSMRARATESFGGCARRVSACIDLQFLRRTRVQFAFCDPLVRPFRHHQSALTQKNSRHCWQLQRVRPSSPSRCEGWHGRVSLVLAPASIDKFCGAHCCSAHYVTLECPFRHHQSALTSSSATVHGLRQPAPQRKYYSRTTVGAWLKSSRCTCD